MPSAIGCAGLGHVTRHQQTLTLCVHQALEAAESQSSHAGHVPSTEDFEQRCYVSFKPVQE